MRARPAVFGLALLAATFSGCVAAEDEPTDGTPAPETPDYVVPAIPEIAVEDLFAKYRPFVEDYNVRRDNHADHLGARDALEAMFVSYGLEVYRQEFETDIAQENIIGIKWGVDRQNWVVVGGHYDTTTGGTHDEESQGAYDDGSGTMMTVQLAEAFSQIDSYYTIAFVAFDGEEKGLQGSGYLFNSVIDESFPYANITFRAMLDIDMFGLNWPICAPIYFDTNDAVLREFAVMVARELGIPDEFFKTQGITLGQSDYAHWYNYEDTHYPTAFFIADFEELAAPVDGGQAGPAGCLPPAPGAYPFWHRVDTWETMEAMAGGPENLAAGFQTGLDLVGAMLHFMAADPAVTFEGG